MSEIERVELTLGKMCPFQTRALGAATCSKNCALFIERQVNTFLTDKNGVLLLDDDKEAVIIPKLMCGCVFVHTERSNNDVAGSGEALSQMGVELFKAMNISAKPGRVKKRKPEPAHLAEASE